MSSLRPNKKGVDDFMDQGELVLLSNQTIPSYGTTHDATCKLIVLGHTPQIPSFNFLHDNPSEIIFSPLKCLLYYIYIFIGSGPNILTT